jgi:small redox-active disulfide protein 2
MVIKVLGSGCPNCKRVELLAKEVTRELGVEAQIEKVSGYKEIMSYGIMATPGLVIDEKVVSAGRVPSKTEMTKYITSALNEEK